jgi:spore germination protein KC
MNGEKLRILSCFVIIALVLSGCWNYREIESLAIVSGIAVDKEDGKYSVTYEILDIKSGRDVDITPRLLTVKGCDMFEAFRNTIKLSGEKLYTSHAKALIISEEIAREGVIPVIDWVGRDNQPRDTLRLFIAKGTPARTILEQKPMAVNTVSFELDNIFTWESKLSNTVDTEQWQFRSDLNEKCLSATLSVVGTTDNDGEACTVVSGAGVFKKDKLVGFLSDEETKSLLFVTNKLKGGLLTGKEEMGHESAIVSLEILDSKTKRKPRYENGKIIMDIIINTDVSIGEIGGSIDVIDEPGRAKLKTDFEAMVEGQIKALVAKMQKEQDCDIFGFGKTIKRAQPDLWRQIESDWDHWFPKVQMEVHSTIHIKNSALESKPERPG